MGERTERETIFALSTAAGAAGIAVIRVSGPKATQSLRLVKNGNRIKERTAGFRRVFDETSGVEIDDAIVLWFQQPASYTGEDVVEFQTHGGRAVTAALLAALAKLPTYRPAEPGEFTRRAVENGRIDLTRAEAVADIVGAETEAQRLLALRQYDGGLAQLYSEWRERLIRAAAWVEAGIDFADEEVPEGIVEQGRADLRKLHDEALAHLADARRGEIIREGFHIAVIGPPNAGKSSLVNALARRDVAIISEQPGTTRDVIEVTLDLAGYAVVLADTAGLRDSVEPIEREGIRRARARAEAADLCLLVLDAAAPDSDSLQCPADLVVWNKADLVQERHSQQLYISAKTGEGLPELTRMLGERAAEGGSADAPLLTRARHRYAVEQVIDCIGAALVEDANELAAEQLRRALRALGRITGAVDLDELLDVVFRDFCIGK
jgi:tRNA modification GTPase